MNQSKRMTRIRILFIYWIHIYVSSDVVTLFTNCILHETKESERFFRAAVNGRAIDVKGGKLIDFDGARESRGKIMKDNLCIRYTNNIYTLVVENSCKLD